MQKYIFAPSTIIQSAQMNEMLAMCLASGIVQSFAGAAAPAGWLLCNGASLLRTDYPDLFSAIGVKYGSADGTHFNVPDGRGRVAVGKDGTAEFLDLGSYGGEKAHILTTAELAVHAHGDDHNHSAQSGGISANHTHSGSPDNYYHIKSGIDGSWAWAHSSNGYQTGTVSSDHSHFTTMNYKSTQGFGTTTANAGSGTAHNNLQPYLTFNFIIKI